MAPKIQSLADIMAELSPGYQGQKDLLAQQGTQLKQQGDEMITGLTAQRGEAWNDIGRSANARGFAFGGIRADEQARYDSTQFMPAVANAKAQTQKGVGDLMMAGAQLDTEARNTAMGWQQNQQQALNSWNMQQAQLEASRRENELNRQFESSQNAMNRSASSANSGSTLAEAYSAALAGKATVRGGYVSSSDYKALRNQFVSSGAGSASDFSKRFSSFVEPGQWKTYQ